MGCECVGQLAMTEEPPDLYEPRSCLHCGKPTPPKKWRCEACRFTHNSERDHVMAVLADARRTASRAATR